MEDHQMTEIINDGSASFKKELAKLKKKHPEHYRRIYINLRKLEKKADSIQNLKYQPNGLKYFDEIWQYQIGDHRVVFHFNEQGEIHYDKLFEKKKNKTPKRHIKTAKKRK
jgi:phage-related protein